MKRAVIPGFYGADAQGGIHTFPRGGGDITGAVIARGVRADLYENWTDVSGVFADNPKTQPRTAGAAVFNVCGICGAVPLGIGCGRTARRSGGDWPAAAGSDTRFKYVPPGGRGHDDCICADGNTEKHKAAALNIYEKEVGL